MKKMRTLWLALMTLVLVLTGCQQMPVLDGTSGESQTESSQLVSETQDGDDTDVPGDFRPGDSQSGSADEGAAGSESGTESEPESESEDLHEYDFTLCFAGDISLDENAVTTAMLDKNGGDISKCISPELLAVMRDADLMCLNNEFTYSTNGSPMNGKKYTFRANPTRVSVLNDMGVDIVTLANNHVYDYGKQALLDTFDTLEDAGIDYFGAGRNLEEAMAPVYYEIDGKTIAFVGASRAEKYKLTPQATEDEPGILRCYDTELFLKSIREADENADFVIAVVHWGTEYSTKLEEVQRTTGKAYLDAGADAIIGGHSHCLQGMEFYEGKPIVYSLGNYWFNKKTLDSMLVQLRFTGNDEGGSVELSLVPALQSGNKTQIVTDPEKVEALYDRLEDISVNVEIDEYGEVTKEAN